MVSERSTPRRQGVLVDWDDDRGFGFIAPDPGGSRVFVHVSEFPRGRRPVAGCEVTYAEVRDERNRLQASQVRYRGKEPTRKARGKALRPALAVTALYFAGLVGLVALDELPVVFLGAYVLFSVVAFFLYGTDKAAAVQHQWRTPESTLHAVALIGGWPGALVARQAFRHKTSKQPFRTFFWVTVVLNCVALAWWIVEAPVALP